jgi:glyoxylase-like metal-dependent hydrolase (beta-lactamase superfamily II)
MAARERCMMAPYEFAPGVYQMPVGSGPLRGNVYFVRSGAGAASGAGPRPRSAARAAWVLIDTGVPGCGPEIRAAAEGLFGAGAAPVAILITHAHPDHVGSALELSRDWRCPVYVNGADARALGGRRHVRTLKESADLREYTAAPEAPGEASAGDALRGALLVPGLPDWQGIPTPGHTRGHVAFFRAHDRVLIAGDAVVTEVEPLSALFGKSATVCGPPWYFTWSRSRAKRAIARLAELEPLVVAGGHGRPQAGPELPAKLRELAADY